MSRLAIAELAVAVPTHFIDVSAVRRVTFITFAHYLIREARLLAALPPGG